MNGDKKECYIRFMVPILTIFVLSVVLNDAYPNLATAIFFVGVMGLSGMMAGRCAWGGYL